MSRYIDAEHLKETLNSIRTIIEKDYGSSANIVIGCLNAACNEVDREPTADVEPIRHAHWIEQGRGYNWSFVCSQCGHVDGFPFNERMKYCPNCGAYMDEEEKK